MDAWKVTHIIGAIWNMYLCIIFFDFSCFIQNQYSYMFLLIGAFKINLSYL